MALIQTRSVAELVTEGEHTGAELQRLSARRRNAAVAVALRKAAEAVEMLRRPVEGGVVGVDDLRGLEVVLRLGPEDDVDEEE